MTPHTSPASAYAPPYLRHRAYFAALRGAASKASLDGMSGGAYPSLQYDADAMPEDVMFQMRYLGRLWLARHVFIPAAVPDRSESRIRLHPWDVTTQRPAPAAFEVAVSADGEARVEGSATRREVEKDAAGLLDDVLAACVAIPVD